MVLHLGISLGIKLITRGLAPNKFAKKYYFSLNQIGVFSIAEDWSWDKAPGTTIPGNGILEDNRYCITSVSTNI